MNGSSPVAMDRDDIEAFLGTGGTCVLALAAGGTPYAVPVSYGYDPDRGAFFLRLGDAGDSEKRRFFDEAAPARLVVYETGGGTTASVIAEGPLEAVDASDLTPDLVAVLSQGAFPHFELWDEPKTDVEFTIARLEPTELTGRRAPREE
jgi:hypothetical protein